MGGTNILHWCQASAVRHTCFLWCSLALASCRAAGLMESTRNFVGLCLIGGEMRPWLSHYKVWKKLGYIFFFANRLIVHQFLQLGFKYLLKQWWLLLFSKFLSIVLIVFSPSGFIVFGLCNFGHILNVDFMVCSSSLR